MHRGVQWDTALNFIDPGYKGYAKDSSNKGWFTYNYDKMSNGNTETNVEWITGKDLIYSSNPTVIANRHKNIYDMAGNSCEWTMEVNSYVNGSVSHIARSGVYDGSGFEIPASERMAPGDTYNNGIRIALYVK